MDVSRTKANGTLHIAIDGSFDAAAVASSSFAVDHLAHSEQRDVFLDMTRTTYIDETGLATLVFMIRQLNCTGRTLTLYGLTGQPRQLVDMLGLANSMEVAIVDETDEKNLDLHFIRKKVSSHPIN